MKTNLIEAQPSAERKDCSGSDTKETSDEVPVLVIWGLWSTRSLPLPPGSLSPRVLVPVRVSFISQVEFSY